MTTVSRNAEILAVDAFLADAKTLDGPPPQWLNGSRVGEWQATWNVADSVGIVSGQLRFVARKADRSIASVSLVFRNKMVWRVDLDLSTTCHPNPHWAPEPLPATVCGPHSHSWHDNRSYLVSQDLWQLPCRRPLPTSVRRLGQALLWLAGEINLSLEPDQRGFEGPSQRDLFD